MQHRYLIFLFLFLTGTGFSQTPKTGTGRLSDHILEKGKNAFEKGNYKQSLQIFDEARKQCADSSDFARWFLVAGEVALHYGDLDRIYATWRYRSKAGLSLEDQCKYGYLCLKKAWLLGEITPFLAPFDSILPQIKGHSLPKQARYYHKISEFFWKYERPESRQLFFFLKKMEALINSGEVSETSAAEYWCELAYAGIGLLPEDSIQLYFNKSGEALDKHWPAEHLARCEAQIKLLKWLNQGGRYGEVLEKIDTYEKILSQSGIERHIHLPDFKKNKALAIRAMGNPEAALPINKEVIMTLETWYPQGHRYLGSYYNSLSTNYDNLKKGDEDYEQFVVNILLKAIELDRKNQVHPWRIAMLTHNLALTYQGHGKFERAFPYFVKSRDSMLKYLGPDHLDVARVSLGLGEIYLRLGENRKAIREARFANRIFAKRTPLANSGRIRANIILGYFLYWDKQYNEAETYLLQAYKGYFPDVPVGQITRLKAPEHFKAYDFQNLTNIFVMLGDLYGALSMKRDEVKNLKLASSCYEVLTTWIDQYEIRASFAEEGWWLEYNILADYSSWLFYIYKLFLKTGDRYYAELAFAVSDKFKTRSIRYQLQGNRALTFAAELEEELKEGQKLQDAYTELEEYLLGIRGPYLDPTRMDTLTLEYEKKRQRYFDWKKGVEKKYPEYFNLKYDHHLIMPDEVRKKIDTEQTLVIEYFWQEDYYLFESAFDDQKTVFTAFNVDLELNELVDGFAELISSLSNAENRSFDSAFYKNYCEKAHKLYNVLLAPVLDSFEEKKYKKLLIIPHGKLAKIPFDILLSAKPDSQLIDYSRLPYIIKDHEIRYEYAASLIKQSREAQSISPSTNPYFGLAPDFAEGLQGGVRTGFAKLRFNEVEVQGAYDQFSGKKMGGRNIDVKKVKKYVSRAAILHFATHTLINDTLPMYSALVLGENPKQKPTYLHAYEIYQLKLAAHLAVLSACETGLGQIKTGEGMMSLARAFKYAGCPNIVMSLWKADDELSSKLIVRFFAYLRAGKSKSEALRLAKLDHLRHSSNQQFPYYWAPFVLIGDDLPVQVEEKSNFPYLLILLIGSLLFLFLFFTRKIKKH